MWVSSDYEILLGVQGMCPVCFGMGFAFMEFLVVVVRIVEGCGLLIYIVDSLSWLSVHAGLIQ